MHRLRALLALIVTLALAPVPALAEPDLTLVQTESGPVRGKVDNNVIGFQGIPFAQPPIGSLRWRAPQPARPWTEPLEAFDFRSDCMQPTSGSPSLTPSEDCLYLNIWRRSAASPKPLPVFVWIYGGGLVKGGASMYPGDQLAKHGILVVTFNYRLGRFGFFAHPALAAESPGDARGNYGYMDQLAVLQWIQRNIAAFGGDPKHVTIAGESAGGGSVLALLTSPMATGLFERAVLQSPAIPSPRENATPMRSLKDAEKMALDYAHSLGVANDEAEGLTKLRAVPAKQLNEGTENYVVSIFGGPDIPGLSHSIIDGKLVAEAPERVLREGRQAKVPVIIGANDADLAYSLAKTKDELFAAFGSRAARARELYDPKGDAKLEDLVQAVVADAAMIEPSRFLAEAVTKGGKPAFLYRFSYVPELWRESMSGAKHATEIMFMFGLAKYVLKEKLTETDEYIGTTMSAYWGRFARVGQPNADGKDDWQAYDPEKKEVFHFKSSGVATGPDPLKDRLDLWATVRDEQATQK